jgi:hypothetical protein
MAGFYEGSSLDVVPLTGSSAGSPWRRSTEWSLLRRFLWKFSGVSPWTGYRGGVLSLGAVLRTRSIVGGSPDGSPLESVHLWVPLGVPQSVPRRENPGGGSVRMSPGRRPFERVR